MLEQENLNNIEELVRCIVWHYNDDRFIVLDDDSTYEYLEEYRSAIQS
jgi:glycosyltransferase involved in cell wall biosynthesis